MNNKYKDLEFSLICERDYELARIYFDEFISGADGTSAQAFSGRNGIDYLVIYEKVALRLEPYYKPSELRKMRKSELVDLCEYYAIYVDPDAYNRAELIEFLFDISTETHYKYVFENEEWRDLPCDFTVTGYSQGDAVKVVRVGKVGHSAESIAYLLYDSPIYARLEISGANGYEDEIYLDDYLIDRYEYSKDEILVGVLKHYNDRNKYAVIAWLADNLPDDV